MTTTHRCWKIEKAFIGYTFYHPDHDPENVNDWRYGTADTEQQAREEIDRLLEEDAEWTDASNQMRKLVEEALTKQENDRTLWTPEWQQWSREAQAALGEASTRLERQYAPSPHSQTAITRSADVPVGMKPCPFCGGEGDIESQPSYSQAANTYDRYRGWCDHCSFGLDWHSYEADAITAWNTRASLSPTHTVSDIGVDAAQRGGEALREALEWIVWRETQRVCWSTATEDEAHATRIRVCAERRKQWPGTDDECDHDGSCDECVADMAEEHETDASKAVRAAGKRILAALATQTEKHGG